jgi:3-hydroxyacyl-[acyl-carrier protein] dehydratase/trans-2-decenoyl-[acyl-carrier protein] isomerase
MYEKKAAYSYPELIDCGYGLWGDVPSLPLPPMLMFDRIIEIKSDGGKYGKGVARAQFDIKPDLWFFPCHFYRDPVMPGCLGIDALWQLTGFFLGWSGARGNGRALGCGGIKFHDQVLPTAGLLTYVVDIKMMRISRKGSMVISDGCLLRDGEPIYEAAELKVIVVPEE